jgi:hypothetical protein
MTPRHETWARVQWNPWLVKPDTEDSIFESDELRPGETRINDLDLSMDEFIEKYKGKEIRWSSWTERDTKPGESGYIIVDKKLDNESKFISSNTFFGSKVWFIHCNDKDVFWVLKGSKEESIFESSELTPGEIKLNTENMTVDEFLSKYKGKKMRWSAWTTSNSNNDFIIPVGLKSDKTFDSLDTDRYGLSSSGWWNLAVVGRHDWILLPQEEESIFESSDTEEPQMDLFGNIN